MEMVAAILAGIGFVWGYVFAGADARTKLNRIKYAAGFAIAFALFGSLLGIALDQFLPPL